jgi:hypothetical protein
MVCAISRLYADLKVVLELGKLKTEIIQGVGVKQGDNMASVFFLFLMSAFADLIELEWMKEKLKDWNLGGNKMKLTIWDNCLGTK